MGPEKSVWAFWVIKSPLFCWCGLWGPWIKTWASEYPIHVAQIQTHSGNEHGALCDRG